MEAFIIGLAGAAVSGLTFMAYRHPTLYEREFSKRITQWVIGLMVVAIIYNSGIDAADGKLAVFLRPDVTAAAKAAIHASKVDEIWLGLGAAVVAFVFFLDWLAKHMKSEREAEKGVEQSE